MCRSRSQKLADSSKRLFTWNKRYFSRLHLSDAPADFCDLSLFNPLRNVMRKTLDYTISQLSTLVVRKQLCYFENMGNRLRHKIRIQHTQIRATSQ